MKYSILFLLALILVGSDAVADRKWERFRVPDAFCGNGSDYRIYIDRRSSDKVAFYFQGGGACWNEATCFGRFSTTRVSAGSPKRAPAGFLSDNPKKSPVADYSVVFFPYCTGDVFVGTHVARYRHNKEMHHTGNLNIQKAMAALSSTGLQLNSATDIVVYGYSAGAIGALYHLQTIDPYLRWDQKKVLLSDAPGLHFGRHFWDKFSPALQRDFEAALGAEKLPGNVAFFAYDRCRHFPDWRIGILQGSRDIVMSAIFGNTTPFREMREIFSDDGLYSLTEAPDDNCSAWIPNTPMHTFLLLDQSARFSVSGESALEYAHDIIEGTSSQNYPKRHR